MSDPTPTPEDWDRSRRILVAYGPKFLGCDMTPLALEFACVRSDEREACAKLADDAAYVTEKVGGRSQANPIRGVAAKIRSRGAS